MTVPTFFNFDKGLGDTTVSTSIQPFIIMTNKIGPRWIFEDAAGGGGGSPPTSGQLWPRRA